MKALATLLLVFSLSLAYAQTYTEVSNYDLPNIFSDNYAWVDFNNDGYMDIIATEIYYTKLYQNNGNNSFTEFAGTPFPGMLDGRVSCGDFNSDGYIDILLTGDPESSSFPAGAHTLLYQNNGGTNFTLVSNTPFVGITKGGTDFGDMDSDGDPDIIVYGKPSSGILQLFVYENLNNGNSFSLYMTRQFNSGKAYGAEWGDFEGDGDLDILLNGYAGVLLYINQNDLRKFTPFNHALFPSCELHWEDLDNDGDLDIISHAGAGSIYVHTNDNKSFAKITSYYNAQYYGNIALGDANGDGLTDVARANQYSLRLSTALGNDFYTRDLLSGTHQTTLGGEISMVDTDNDGDLDVYLSRFASFGSFTNRLYTNKPIKPNTPPGIPNIQFMEPEGRLIKVYFTPPTDNSTPIKGLTFDYALGTSSNQYQRHYPEALLSTGRRKSTGQGPIKGSKLHIHPNDLNTNDSLYLRIQAIDQSYQGSFFSQEFVFRIPLLLDAGADTIILATDSIQLNYTHNYHGGSNQLTTTWSSLLTPSLSNDSALWVNPQSSTKYYVQVQSPEGWIAYDTINVIINKEIFSPLSQNFPGVYGHASQWVDFNNDGFLDVSIMGDQSFNNSIVKLYKNNTNNTFNSVTTTGLSSRSRGSLDWGDLNNDGWADAMVCGYVPNSGNNSKLYISQGNGAFSTHNSGLFKGTSSSHTSIFDYNSDGDLDIFTFGTRPTSYYGIYGGIYTYENLNSTTLQLDSTLPPFSTTPNLYNASFDWGDYNRDGIMDFIVKGIVGSAATTPTNGRVMLYKGTDDGLLMWDTENQFRDISTGDIKFGDYDNDGDLDILLAGNHVENSISNWIIIIYKNNGLGRYYPIMETNIGQGIQAGMVDWGDYDNDGDLDVCVSGNTIAIYSNEGSDLFIEQNEPAIASLFMSSGKWGDYDNDGDLDLLVNGINANNNNITKIYTNDVLNTNTPPSVPDGLKAIPYNKGMLFMWNPSTDNETPTQSLSYNIMIGSDSGRIDIKCPQAYLSSGKMHIPGRGNTQLDTFFILRRNLQPGDSIFWSIQAVDNAYLNSSFSTNTLSIIDLQVSLGKDTILNKKDSLILTPIVTYSGSENLHYKWHPSNGLSSDTVLTPTLTASSTQKYHLTVSTDSGSIAVDEILISVSDSLFVKNKGFNPETLINPISYAVDYNNDGNMDIFMTGLNDNYDHKFNIYTNHSASGFSKTDSINLINWTLSPISFGDFNNDGHIDLLTQSQYNYNRNTSIYINNGQGNFELLLSDTLPGCYYCDYEWVDYNNDGLQDIAISGEFQLGSGKTHLYTNNGDSTFTLDSNNILAPFRKVKMEWFDFNNDGYQDLLLHGKHTNLYETKLYSNSINGILLEQTQVNLPGFANSEYNFGDFDADGYIDLLANSETSNLKYLFKNQGGIDFTEVHINGLSHQGFVSSWTDYNHDGYLDCYFGNKLYAFNGYSFQPVTNAHLPTLDRINVCVADFNNDNTLDMIISGKQNQDHHCYLFNNIHDSTNTSPSTPTNLHSYGDSSYYYFHWSPSHDQHTPNTAIRYNVWIGTDSINQNLLQPYSLPVNGQRLVYKNANASTDTLFKFPKNVLQNYPGFYWRVQAIDNNYLASAFSSPVHQTFCSTSSYQTHFDTLCFGDSIPFNNQFVFQSGNYQFIGNDQFGCDSIVYLHLFVTDSLPSFSIFGDTSTYQYEERQYSVDSLLPLQFSWHAINGTVIGTPQNHTTKVHWDNTGYGEVYTIGKSQYGCITDTSHLLVNVLFNHLNKDFRKHEIIAYPIPASNFVTIELSETFSKKVTISLLNSSLSVIQQEYSENNKITLDLHDIPKGIYFIKVHNDEINVLRKLIIQ